VDGSPASCCAPLPEIYKLVLFPPTVGFESADGRRTAVRTGTVEAVHDLNQAEVEVVTPVSAKAAVTSVLSGTKRQWDTQTVCENGPGGGGGSALYYDQEPRALLGFELPTG
jgi:hypothetical protein